MSSFDDAIYEKIHRSKVHGTVNTVNFTGDNILAGSLSIVRACSDATDFQIGSAMVSTLKMTFLRNLSVSSWNGAVITLYYDLMTDDDPETWESYPLGIFDVVSATEALDGVVVQAYDRMAKFDKAIATEIPVGNLYNTLRWACTQCDVPFGMTSTEVSYLANGASTTNFEVYGENDIETYRDLLFWLTQACAGWARINRDGELVIVGLQDSIIGGRRVYDYQLMKKNFLSWDVYYSQIGYMYQDQGEKFVGNTTGRLYELGFNPFLQANNSFYPRSLVNNILLRFQANHYYPFDCTILCDPRWEPGDLIEFMEGENTQFISIVQSVEFTFGKSMTLRCYGKNPEQGSYSKKESGRTQSQIEGTKLRYFTYTNPSDVTIEAGEDAQIVDITFGAEVSSFIEMWHSVKFASDYIASGDITAKFYLDSVEQDFSPTFRYREAEDEQSLEDTINLNYFANILTPGLHRWQVVLENNTDQDITIDTGDCIGLLKGQGLSENVMWDGLIQIDENLEMVAYIAYLCSLTESVTVSFNSPLTVSLSDSVYAAFNQIRNLLDEDTVTITLTYIDSVIYCGESNYAGNYLLL